MPLVFDWQNNEPRQLNLTELPLPESVTTHNQSLYAHIYVEPVRRSSLPSLRRAHRLNVYRAPFARPKTAHLFGAEADAETKPAESVASTQEWVSYWRPELQIRLVVDHTSYPVGSSIPEQVRGVLHFDKNGRYAPVIYLDYFWLLNEDFILLNDTVKGVPLLIRYSHISLFKWQMQRQMDESFRMQLQWGSTESDTQEIRRMLQNTNPILLGTTVFVSVLHMIFDMLAFKNDIKFWREAQSMEGLSVRSIIINGFAQVVVFLYLLDNETSWMILLSSGIGILIEFWKIGKAVDITIERTSSGWPRISFQDMKSYSESETAQYDREATRYLSYAAAPLMVGYAIYSMIYVEHKGWYSFILSTLVGFVYTFGFITMCPQLYLNYKLKSVAHLPWRMLTYKALNTFIDDLFAFIIKMPMLHRIACFRDDIIFFIYLYQRWIYRIDYTRVNEFGLVPDKEAKHKKDDDAKDNALETSAANMTTTTSASIESNVERNNGGDGDNGGLRHRAAHSK